MTINAKPIVHIRPYSAADRAACMAIFRSNLPRYFASSELQEFEIFLENTIGDYFVVENDQAVIACGGCYTSDQLGYLSWGMVARDHHRSAIGSSLLAWRIDALFSQPQIAKVMIETSQHTAGFFARYGFRCTQQIHDGFGPGIDKVSMSLVRRDWRMQRRRVGRFPALADGAT